ncbi:hypothetical protein Dda_8844 [Drechslerella dactyloides]|uniref:Uncharacterized protein n=1 Tax=Drechslerella dactyloides TaxID=74499 RepID=A0AAD6NEQ3_DREDA|nr:hypothetical protein Dda_8844 [Drechslerella dactyloides]
MTDIVGAALACWNVPDVVFPERAIPARGRDIATYYQITPHDVHARHVRKLHKIRMSIHLLDLLSPAQPILYNAIFSYLDPADTLHLLATCHAVQELKPLLWSINRSLRRFLNDPLAFRSLMAKHNAIVSGSHALQFLSRFRWDDSDLDVYITGVDGLLEFAKHLVEHEGFAFSPYSWQSDDAKTAIIRRKEEGDAHIGAMIDEWNNQNNTPGQQVDQDLLDGENSEMVIYSMRAIEGVFNFVHPSNAARRIQLIAARSASRSASQRSSPITAILSDYYATHIFNFFTWDAAYSLFPRHTFTDNRAYYTNSLTRRSHLAIEKYHGRGFTFHDYGSYHKCVKSCPFRPHRRVGDAYTWVMELDTTGVNPSDIAEPTSVLRTSTWGMKMHSSWWNRDEKKRMFRSEAYMQMVYTWENSECFRYPRLYDRHTKSLGHFIRQMESTIGPLGGYQVDFEKARDKDWFGLDEFFMDDHFAAWYKFWEESIMPYDNIWAWQYPMLGGEETPAAADEGHADVVMTGQ